MSDAAKNRTVRILLHALVLFALYVLQAMIFSHLRIFGVTPLILPIMVVGVALFEGPSWGGGFGLAAGVLSDIAFLDATVLFTIALTATGMGVGILSTYFLRRGLPSYILCVGAVLVLITFLQIFPPVVFHGEAPLTVLRVAGLQTLYSLLFTIPLYYLARGLGRRARADNR